MSILVWVVAIWLGVLAVSSALLAGFGVMDWMRHKSPDADTNPDTARHQSGAQGDAVPG
jgi:hypothetical protein